MNDSGVENITNKKPLTIGSLGFIVFLLIIFVSVKINRSILDQWTPAETIVGKWTGEAVVFAPFTETESSGEYPDGLIDIEIIIAADGKVTGKIGQAELVNCTVRQNRTWFERLIGIKNDYIIDGGTLENGIAQQDKVSKRDIRIPFNLTDGKLDGSVFEIESWKYPDPLIPRLLLDSVEN